MEVRNLVMRLGAQLFGAEDDRANSRAALARYLALAAVLAAIVCYRRPDAILNPQFWGEDGNVYFLDQLAFGFWQAAPKLWNGFPYLVQRLVAWAAAALPLAAVPLAYNLSAIAITAVTMATFSLPAFRHLVASDALRAATCMAIVCMPAGKELLATSTNLSWFLAPWLTWLSVMRAPRSPVLAAGWCLGGVLAVLSTPLAAVNAPFWVLRVIYGAYTRRGRDLGFALAQLTSLVAVFGITRSLGAGDFLDVDGSLVVLKTGGSMIFRWHLAHLWSAAKTLPLAAAWSIDAAIMPSGYLEPVENLSAVRILAPALILTGCLGLSARGLAQPGRRAVLLGAYLLCASLFVVLAGRHNIVRGFQHMGAGVNAAAVLFSRYRVVPNVAVVLAAAGVIDGARTARKRTVTALIALWIWLFVWVPALRIPPFQDHHWPAWAAMLERKIADGTPGPLVIPINPSPYAIVFDPATPVTRPSGVYSLPDPVP